VIKREGEMLSSCCKGCMDNVGKKDRYMTEWSVCFDAWFFEFEIKLKGEIRKKWVDVR
jgi:hypothetical protein